MTAPVRTRFAPSPTGDLHLGGAWTALASWVIARAHGGAFVVRVEDLDPPRVVRDSAAGILGDLQWLGLEYDEGPDLGGLRGPYEQSARGHLYQGAITSLVARGLAYPCDCSRAEIARAASAPHPGEEAVYPGTCRDLDPGRVFKRDPALRLRVPEGTTITVQDLGAGAFTQDLSREVGDFVLRRGDGVYAYQLAVIVDDLGMHITDVIRGADLLPSTPRQVLLAHLLGSEAPRYTHLPLVVASDGTRLAKRTGGASVHALRAAGVSAPEIIGKLAHGLGLAPDDRPRRPKELPLRVPSAWPREPWRVPQEWAHVLPAPTPKEG